MKVRPYEPKDFEDVRRICRETCTDPRLLNPDTFLITKYADCYTESWPEFIQIFADDADRAQGYLLCCPDYADYLRVWRERYDARVPKSPFRLRCFLLYVKWEVRYMARKGYPAHLHIDISPEFQKLGGGSQMMASLLTLLRAKSVPGIYLGCSKSNIGGNAFYQKCGFVKLQERMGCNIYTMKL